MIVQVFGQSGKLGLAQLRAAVDRDATVPALFFGGADDRLAERARPAGDQNVSGEAHAPSDVSTISDRIGYTAR